MKPSLFIPLSLALYAPSALAQDAVAGLDAHGFNLAALTDDPRAALQVQRPVRFEQWDVYIGGLFEYAHEPLVYVTQVEGSDPTVTPVLDNVVALNLSAGLALFDWLRIDAGMPLFFTSTGLDGNSNGFGIGDARVAAMVEVVRPKEGDAGGFGLGIVPFLDIPIGNDEVFLGQGGITGGGKLAATYEAGSVTLGGEAGVQFQPEVTGLDNLTGSDRVLIGAQLGYLFSPTFGANFEGKVYVPFTSNVEAGTETPAELTLSVKKRLDSGAHFLAGASTAVSQGVSAADFRVFLGGGFGTIKDYAPKISDRDGDKITDYPDNDRCPDDPETYNGRYDEDGCPEKPVSLAVTVAYEGKPVTGAEVEVKGGASPMSAKSTGAAWVVDAEAVRKYDATAKYGSCLAGANSVTTGEEGRTDLAVTLVPVLDAFATAEVVDKDGKVIPDAKVSWSSETQGCVPVEPAVAGSKTAVGAGNHTAMASAPGYRPGKATLTVASGESKTARIVLEPTQIVLKKDMIVILTPVYFDYDKDTIKSESFQILDDVYQTLVDHPEIAKVEVAGHTDSDGSDKYNEDLSQRRVESVRKYLIDKGVNEARLVAKGYGESKPIASNKTETGKAKNRRVEFVITERTVPEGQGGGKNR